MKSVIVCGAGMYGVFAYCNFYDKLNIKFFVDPQDSMNPHMTKTSVPIYPFQTLNKVNRSESIIVAIEDPEIRAQAVEALFKAGFQNLALYTPPEYVTSEYCFEVFEKKAKQSGRNF